MLANFKNINSINDLFKSIQEYLKQIIASVVIVVIIVGCTFGYFHYRKSYEQGAHTALVEAMKYFNAKVKSESESSSEEIDFFDKKEFSSHDEKWEKVAAVFKEGYESYKSSGIASMFLAYQSEALNKQSKIDEAIVVLNKALREIKSEEVKQYYKVKLALMTIDKGKDSPELVEQGIGILKSIATQDDNVANDLALYRLGEYYWYEKNFEETKNYWNQLLLKYGEKSERPSPFVSKMKSRLELIDSNV